MTMNPEKRLHMLLRTLTMGWGIRELIALNTWTEKWSGEEEAGDAPFDFVMGEVGVQPLLVGG